MKRSNDQCLERVSPQGIRIHSDNVISNLYAYSFLEDISCHFSILFSQSVNHHGFYTIESDDNKLIDLLSFEDYGFLEYNFDKVLSSIMHNLVFANKTFIEIAFSKNDKGEIVGISLLPFDAIKILSSKKYLYFLSSNTDKTLSAFRLEKYKCVEFDIKELGLCKNCFRRIIKKLKKIDITSSTKFILDDKMKTKFSLEDFRKKQDFLVLKYPREVGWFGSGSNSYLNESYFLFRMVKLRELQLKCLFYFIEKINSSMNNLSNLTKVNGVIKTTMLFPQYQNEWERYKNGEISSSELSNIIFPNVKKA